MQGGNILRYNKKDQPFTIIGRFRILESEGEREYCRIKFHSTGNVAVIPSGLVKTLDFEDPSLITDRIEEPELTIVPTDEVIDVKEDDTEYELPEEITPSKPIVIATNKDGKKFEVEDIEAFAIEHKLDLEAIEAVLDGKQKTHRKWRFKTV